MAEPTDPTGAMPTAVPLGGGALSDVSVGSLALAGSEPVVPASKGVKRGLVEYVPCATIRGLLHVFRNPSDVKRLECPRCGYEVFSSWYFRLGTSGASARAVIFLSVSSAVAHRAQVRRGRRPDIWVVESASKSLAFATPGPSFLVAENGAMTPIRVQVELCQASSSLAFGRRLLGAAAESLRELANDDVDLKTRPNFRLPKSGKLRVLTPQGHPVCGKKPLVVADGSAGVSDFSSHLVVCVHNKCRRNCIPCGAVTCSHGNVKRNCGLCKVARPTTAAPRARKARGSQSEQCSHRAGKHATNRCGRGVDPVGRHSFSPQVRDSVGVPVCRSNLGVLRAQALAI